MSFSEIDEQDFPRITPAVQWLIAINIAIFFVQTVTPVGPDAVRNALAFEVNDLTTRPWTIVTYMFVHAGFWHLALNMWMLWIFGPRVEHAWNARSFSFYYILCGLGGWLFHLMIARNGSYLLGASAAIYGVMLAYAMRWPDDEVRFFPLVFIAMKVRWYVVFLIGVNLAMGLWSAQTGGGGVAYVAHLGGLFIGYLYLRFSAAHGIDRLRQRMSQIPDISDETPRAIPRSQPRSRERTNEIDEIVARSNAIAAQRQQSAAPTLTSKVGKKKTDELNLVLDKISERGLGSLTSDERRLLEEMSKKLRNS
jgi:membrane associated rhomboid family serine protease